MSSTTTTTEKPHDLFAFNVITLKALNARKACILNPNLIVVLKCSPDDVPFLPESSGPERQRAMEAFCSADVAVYPPEKKRMTGWPDQDRDYNLATRKYSYTKYGTYNMSRRDGLKLEFNVATGRLDVSVGRNDPGGPRPVASLPDESYYEIRKKGYVERKRRAPPPPSSSSSTAAVVANPNKKPKTMIKTKTTTMKTKTKKSAVIKLKPSKPRIREPPPLIPTALIRTFLLAEMQRRRQQQQSHNVVFENFKAKLAAQEEHRVLMKAREAVMIFLKSF